MSASPWEHFTLEELSCRCGCGQMKMSADFMEKIVKLRKMYGAALPVNSAYRCPAHNAKVSNTGLDGPHTTGHAMDLGIKGKEMLDVLDCARRLGGFTGFGINQKGPHRGRFLHLDDLIEPEETPRPWVWTY